MWVWGLRILISKGFIVGVTNECCQASEVFSLSPKETMWARIKKKWTRLNPLGKCIWTTYQVWLPSFHVRHFLLIVFFF